MGWAPRVTTRIPQISSPISTYEINDYSLGFNTFFSNDKMPFKNGGSNMWRLAKNARIDTLGEYTTRKGTDFHSEPAGQTQDQTITSTTGASDQNFSQTTWLAQKFTANSTGRLSRLDINIKNTLSATGTIIVELWSDVSNEPGSILGRSSISSSEVTGSYQYLPAYFLSAPSLSSSTVYWIVVYIQPQASSSYSWSSTTSATSALTSTNSGMSWSTTSFALNFRQYYSPVGGVKGLWRAYKSDGTKITLFVHNTTLYSVDENTGALTTIKSGLSSSATNYRFELVNDIVYYVNEFDGYRKWDFTTESQVSANNYTHIRQHKGLMFLRERDDPNKVIYSNFADYETFTSTDFIYIPSPKTGDPVTALESLNGYLLIFTLNNKFILSGDDNATFALDEAPDQKGTYSQETVAKDENYVYFLSSDGLYRSNGTEPQILSSDVYNDILMLPNKSSANVQVNKGRVYLWYAPSGQSENNECYVFSLNFGDSGGTTESLDTKTYVGRSFNAFRDDDKLLVGNSRIGVVSWMELDSNDYTNQGDDIDYELQTHYIIGNSPALLKEVRHFQPRFEAQSSNYNVSIEYATELRDNWQVLSQPGVQGEGATYGSGVQYGDGTVYGTTAELLERLYIPGEYRRFAVRYKHYATRQPNTFLGHTFVTQTRRIR